MIDHEFHRPLHHPGSSNLDEHAAACLFRKLRGTPSYLGKTWAMTTATADIPPIFLGIPTACWAASAKAATWLVSDSAPWRQAAAEAAVCADLGSRGQWWLNRPSQKTWKSMRISPARIENIQNVWKIETPRTGKSQEPQWNKTKHKLEGRSCLWLSSTQALQDLHH
jgi:hypothetical protein